MLRSALAISMLICGAGILAQAAQAASQPPTYASAAEAKKACPHDIVVWLNTKSRFYHYKGQPWYGTTDVGAFVCKAEADMAGDTPGDLPIPGQQ